jgi:chemotaxis protein methyltransferase CheR
VTSPAHAPALPDHEVRPLTDREFRLFQGLVYAGSGIWLADGKRALLVSRIGKRVRVLGLATYESYFQLVEGAHGAEERVRLIDAICTHETSFFREARQFDHLAQDLIPQWIAAAAAGTRPRRLRIWSAACSSGEEPYSIAMTLLSGLPDLPPWEIEILATDLSTRILGQARSYLRRFMRRGRGTQTGYFAAGPELRRVIRFAQINLNEGPFPVDSTFDAIFCRNALIYFEPEGRRRAQEHLLHCLAPGGQFFLGHAETLQGSAVGVERVLPTVYRRSSR